MDDPFGILAGIDIASIGINDYFPKRPLIETNKDICIQCGTQMCRGANNLEFICDGCGLFTEGDSAEIDDAPRNLVDTTRLRLVGSNSNQLQPDLYRSGNGSTKFAQKEEIFKEFCSYRILHIEKGGRALPLDACRIASESYNDVQQNYVKRSQNKKAIMAACLSIACNKIGLAPSKSEIASFMQLPTKGIARGSNFVRSLVADGKMDVDVNADTCKSEITTLFAHLGMEGERTVKLSNTVYDIVNIAIDNNIGIDSFLRSKVSGATFVVLRRCKDRNIISNQMGLTEFCQDRIRKNTVERFTDRLDEYHSFFVECYKKYDLIHEPLKPLKTIKAK